MKRPEPPKRMPPAFASWDEFWKADATDLSALPEPLIGRSPVSVLKFLPLTNPRFIYLDRQLWEDPPSIRLGFSAANLMMGPHAGAWKPTLWSMDETVLESYLKNPVKDRQMIANAESLRYPEITFDRSKYHAPVGTKFLMQAVVPSPLYHTNDRVNWWVRLPRLGLAYTFGSELGSGNERVTEALLLICAMSAGNRILASRLNRVLTNTHAAASPTRKRRTFREIATKLAREGTSNQHELWDDAVFLVAKLMFGHHLFYPHDPLVLRAFRVLGPASSAAILELHGWENFEFDSTAGDLHKLFDDLVTDIMFLIQALVRWESPTERDGQGATSIASFSDTVRELVAVILAVTCGTPQWVNTGHRAIAPPHQLLELHPVTLPVFEAAQIESAKPKNSIESLQRVLRHLSPVTLGREADINAVNYSCVTFSAKDVQKSMKVSLPWLSEYVRVRIAHADLTPKNEGS